MPPMMAPIGDSPSIKGSPKRYFDGDAKFEEASLIIPTTRIGQKYSGVK
jgi:hypothetical protein